MEIGSSESLDRHDGMDYLLQGEMDGRQNQTAGALRALAQVVRETL